MVFGVTVGLIFPAYQRSNCGGNSAALAACQGYVTFLQVWTDEHGGKAFDYDPSDRTAIHQLKNLPGARWIQRSPLLAKLEGVRIEPNATKMVIMVCGRAYDNVPQRRFGRSPMTHAVAYSTGETGLVSSEAFSRLDLNGFVDLHLLKEPPTAEPGAKPKP